MAFGYLGSTWRNFPVVGERLWLGYGVGLGRALWFEGVEGHRAQIVIGFVFLYGCKEVLGLGFLADRNSPVEREGGQSVEFRHLYLGEKMNRYTYTRQNIKQAINHLRGKGAAPSFIQDNPGSFREKKKKLYVKDKLVVAEEDVESLLRTLLYERDPEGKYGLGRDTLHHAVMQAFVGVSRRKILTFLRKQGLLQDVRHLPQEKIRGKWKIFDLGSVQIDLVHARRADQVSAEWFGSGEDRYWLTAIEQGTSFFQARFILSKSPLHVAPALKQILDVMGKHFKVKRIFADAGKEFLGKTKELLEERNIKFTAGKRGASIENANATFQRYFYVITRMKRGSLLDATKQAEAHMNNIYNRRIHMTPNQAVKLAKQMGERGFLKKKRRFRRTVDVVPRYKVGQRVRPMAIRRKDKGLGYKSYKGKAW